MSLKIARLTITFQLPGSSSLKDKRRRLRPLKDKFGSRANMAVSETGYHDQWGRSEWQFIVIGDSSRLIEADCSKIEEFCHQLDSYVVAIEREYLH